VGKLALVLAFLAALGAAIDACGEEEQVPAVPSQTAGSSPTLGASSPSPLTTGEALSVCPSLAATSWTWLPPSSNTRAYRSAQFGFSLSYPDDWTICQLPTDAATRDFLGGIQFMDRSGLPHASLYVYANPNQSDLEAWVTDHAGEAPKEERTVGGQRALFTSSSADGSPTAGAYFAKGKFVFSISALKIEDFNAVTSLFDFSEEQGT
jgi:hypothetical protein